MAAVIGGVNLRLILRLRDPASFPYPRGYRRRTPSSGDRAKLMLSEIATTIRGEGFPISSRARRTAAIMAAAITRVDT